METIYEILKWIAIVLIAGFVGYFGRALAMAIIDKFRKPKSEGPEITSADPKAQKKAYKAWLKSKKKKK